jgi:hypothetical protein
MLEDLNNHHLEVVKIPSNQGGYIRVCIDRNPTWYSDLCAEYTKQRKRYPKHRTIIKRCTTIAALGRIANGKYHGVYAERLRSHLEKYAEEEMGAEA